MGLGERAVTMLILPLLAQDEHLLLFRIRERLPVTNLLQGSKATNTDIVVIQAAPPNARGVDHDAKLQQGKRCLSRLYTNRVKNGNYILPSLRRFQA